MKIGNFPDFEQRPLKNLLVLAKKMMAFNPNKRMTVEEAL